MKLKERKKQRGFELFEPNVFVKVKRIAGRILNFQKGDNIFCRGDAGRSLLYVEEGSVEISRFNGTSKGVLISLLGAGDIFGEECLVGVTRRKSTATARSSTTLLAIRRDAFLRVLRENAELSRHFIAYLLARSLRIEKCLVDVVRGRGPKRLRKAAGSARNV
jgi:CRP-like cAMP-binding protein